MIKINNLKELDKFIELIEDIAFFKNLDGQYIYFNNAYLNFAGKSRANILNKTVFDLYSKEQATELNNDDKNILKTNKDSFYEKVFLKEDGEILFLKTSKQIIYDKDKNQLGLFCIQKDITLEKEYEIIYKDTKQILEYIAINDNLEKSLGKITSFAEDRFNDAKCSILLLDEDKKHLVTGSAKSLPNFYNDAIDGITIGENIGSCGSAAFKQERVIIENIDTHENWQPYLALTKKANLHACWSEPVFSSKHKLLGTFAIYHHVKKHPSDFQLKLINSYANLAAVAIEKDNNEKIILAKEHQLLAQAKNNNIELSNLFNTALVGLMYITGERVLIKGNQHLADILGYDNAKEMIGLSMLSLHLSRERFIEFGNLNFQTLTNHENNNIEYQLRKKDGSPIWCNLSGKAIDNTTPADLSKGVLWTILDITKRKTLEAEVAQRTKELEQISISDELTKLYNRKYYNQKIIELLSLYKRYNNKFSIVMYDIDDFKNINDTYGHHTGDKVLVEMSKLVQSLLRKTDLLFRIGGEEFIILIPQTNMKKSLLISEKIRKKISHLDIIKDEKITISIGLTEVKEGDDENSIFKRVDKLLYYSKQHGKNIVSTKLTA